MNREIKFRGWVNADKQIRPVIGVFYNPDTIELMDVNVGNDEKIDWRGQSDVVLMQYTGIKDKNGKEIYEGDIILVPDEYPQSELEPAEPFNFFGEIQFRDGSFGVAWVDDKYAHSKYPRETDMWASFPEFNDEILELKEIEVVGNIFENKDLLEKSF